MTPERLHQALIYAGLTLEPEPYDRTSIAYRRQLDLACYELHRKNQPMNQQNSGFAFPQRVLTPLRDDGA